MEKITDSEGREIKPGFLLRSFHFRDKSCGKNHYLYHVAVKNENKLKVVPVYRLDPSLPDSGGECDLSKELAETMTIIHPLYDEGQED